MRIAQHIENSTQINVVEHIMTRNFWEFFITDDNHTEDIVRAYVMGFESELGDISLNEIKPHIISRTSNLSEVMPPAGYRWMN